MIEYFKNRIALDIDFIINYWWIFIILSIILVVIGIVKNKEEKRELIKNYKEIKYGSISGKSYNRKEAIRRAMQET